MEKSGGACSRPWPRSPQRKMVGLAWIRAVALGMQKCGYSDRSLNIRSNESW